jgi:CDP-diacylglycerol---serine O-phosphatidyltransferase
MITWRQVLPTLFTVAAMMAGFYSLLMSAQGEFLIAAQMIMLSMLLDGFDGNVARLVKGTTKFGAELDTYVDMTSFGIAPAMLAYEAVLKHFGAWGFLLACAIVVSGVMRLSRFRIKDPFRGQRGFQGLPITVNACWLSMFIFVAESGLFDTERYVLQAGPMATLVWTCTVLFLILQVSNIRYPKPTKALIGFIPCILIVTFLFLKMQVAVAAALTILASCFIYAFITPLFPKHADLTSILDDSEDEEPEPTLRMP